MTGEQRINDPSYDMEDRPHYGWRHDTPTDAQVSFLGGGKILEMPVIVKHYYADLLTWVTGDYIKEDGWQVLALVGQRNNPEPRYRKINIGPGKFEDIIVNGAMFLERGATRLVVQIWTYQRPMLMVCCNESGKNAAERFISDIRRLMVERNPYHGGKLAYEGRIRFLELKPQDWEDVIMDHRMKEEIRFNTTGFLPHAEELAKYGIPKKRGVLISGPPGTGKTLLTRVLVTNSPGVTAIMADSGLLGRCGYIESLFELASDLKPVLILLEDIDIVASDRFEISNPREEGLLELLEALDGIEACDGVITVGTTNCTSKLDKAIRQRPQRFDLIVHMELPELAERRSLLRKMSNSIPVEELVLDYIAGETSGFSPAQLQEVLFSMVIRRQNRMGAVELEKPMQFTNQEVDWAIHLISNLKKSGLGFRPTDATAGHERPASLLNVKEAI